MSGATFTHTNAQNAQSVAGETNVHICCLIIAA